MKYLRYMIICAALATGCAIPAYASENLQEDMTPETASTVIRTVPHAIEITVTADSGKDATIYALTGQAVKQLTLPEGTTRIELNPGYYIVRIDGQSKRVVVR